VEGIGLGISNLPQSNLQASYEIALGNAVAAAVRRLPYSSGDGDWKDAATGGRGSEQVSTSDSALVAQYATLC
jgi:hypothetical protein